MAKHSCTIRKLLYFQACCNPMSSPFRIWHLLTTKFSTIMNQICHTRSQVFEILMQNFFRMEKLSPSLSHFYTLVITVVNDDTHIILLCDNHVQSPGLTKLYPTLRMDVTSSRISTCKTSFLLRLVVVGHVFSCKLAAALFGVA